METKAVTLPKGWRMVRFGDVVRNVNENVGNPADNGVERYVGLEHIDPELLHIKRWGLTEEGTTFTRKFTPGQVLFGKRRAYQGKVAVAEFEGICSGDILVFEPSNEQLIPELLPFIVQSKGFFEHALNTSAGSLSPRTKWQDLAAYEFALPPKDEQRRIAEMLWAADEAVESIIEAISATKSLKSSLAKNIFGYNNLGTDPPESPKGSNIGVLSDLAIINPKPSKKFPDDLDVSFLAMADISEEGKILNCQLRKASDVKSGFTYFEDGDILFAKITPCMENGKGALAGGLVNRIGFGSTEFFVLRPKDPHDAQYIYQLTMANEFRIQAKRTMRGSAGQQRVPREFLETYRIPIPTSDERVRLSRLLLECDHILAKQVANRKRLQDTKQQLFSLLQLQTHSSLIFKPDFEIEPCRSGLWST